MMAYLRERDKVKVQTRGSTFYLMLLLLMILLPSFCVNSEAKALQRHKKSLKLLKETSFSSASLIKLRQKRDTFANEHEPFIREINVYHEDVGAAEDYDDDDNYDVIPDMKQMYGDGGGEGYPQQQSPNIGDQISEKAKEVAESFSQMWQSLADSIRHCINAFHRLFDDYDEERDGDGEQQLLVAMEEQYRAKTMHDNEVLMNNYENDL